MGREFKNHVWLTHSHKPCTRQLYFEQSRWRSDQDHKLRKKH